MTAGAGSVERVNELQQALEDDAAFTAWYRRHLPRVYAYLMSRCGNDETLAEELSQQTFVAAINERARFDGRSEAGTWLCGIARHKLADHFRRVEREERRQMHLEVRQIAVDENAVRAPNLDQRVAVGEAMRALPTAQRAVLTFVALDGMSVREAGRLIGRSESAAQSLLYRAREGFRRAYGGEWVDG